MSYQLNTVGVVLPSQISAHMCLSEPHIHLNPTPLFQYQAPEFSSLKWYASEEGIKKEGRFGLWIVQNPYIWFAFENSLADAAGQKKGWLG